MTLIVDAGPLVALATAGTRSLHASNRRTTASSPPWRSATPTSTQGSSTSRWSCWPIASGRTAWRRSTSATSGSSVRSKGEASSCCPRTPEPGGPRPSPPASWLAGRRRGALRGRGNRAGTHGAPRSATRLRAGSGSRRSSGDTLSPRPGGPNPPAEVQQGGRGRARRCPGQPAVLPIGAGGTWYGPPVREPAESPPLDVRAVREWLGGNARQGSASAPSRSGSSWPSRPSAPSRSTSRWWGPFPEGGTPAPGPRRSPWPCVGRSPGGKPHPPSVGVAEAAAEVAGFLEARGIPYAIMGGLALQR